MAELFPGIKQIDREFDTAQAARELHSLMAMREELDGEISTLQDQLKAFMLVSKLETMKAGDYKVSWKAITSARVDTAAIKKDLPELAAQYTKETTSRRFVLA